MKSIADIDNGLAAEDEAVRWRAAEEAGDLAEHHPWDVWNLVLKHGSSANEDTRTAVATCILEHLLEHHFDTFFPLLEAEVQNGNDLLGDTFSRCWKLGLAELPHNATRWDELVSRIRRRRKRR